MVHVTQRHDVRALWLVAVTMTGCWKLEIHVDHKDIEQRIAAELARDGTVADSVTCPGDVVPRVGTTFTCTVVIGDKSYERVATITGVDGKGIDATLSWKRGDAVLASRAVTGLREPVSKLLDMPATIDCGEPVRFLPPDRTQHCKVTSGTFTSEVSFTLGDNHELKRLRFEPPMLIRSKVEAETVSAIHDQKGGDVTVTCGSERLLARPSDGVLRCDGTVGTRRVLVSIDIDDDGDGNLHLKRWQLTDR
jgi:hypothetical protein